MSLEMYTCRSPCLAFHAQGLSTLLVLLAPSLAGVFCQCLPPLRGFYPVQQLPHAVLLRSSRHAVQIRSALPSCLRPQQAYHVHWPMLQMDASNAAILPIRPTSYFLAC